MPEALFGELLRQFFRALLIGGLLCTAGQLLFDLANLTPAHTMSILVSTGSLLAICGIYPALVDFAGFGASLPILNFGNLLVSGAREGALADGFLGILTGMLKPVSAGITAAVVFGFLVALFCKPKG